MKLWLWMAVGAATVAVVLGVGAAVLHASDKPQVTPYSRYGVCVNDRGNVVHPAYDGTAKGIPDYCEPGLTYMLNGR